MINYLSEFNYLSIKLITCQNKLIADQRMIDYSGQSPHNTATILFPSGDICDSVVIRNFPQILMFLGHQFFGGIPKFLTLFHKVESPSNMCQNLVTIDLATSEIKR